MPQSDIQVKAILFDAVGTLFRSRGTIGEIYRDIAAKHGFAADAALIQSRFVHCMSLGQTPVDEADWYSMVRSVFEGLGPFPKFDDFFQEVYRVFRTNQGWSCYPETLPVLNALRQRSYQMGVVSNFDARLPSVLRDLEIGTYFRVVVTPASSGYLKPEPRIFLEATRALGVAPKETLFVGDDPIQDFKASSQAGLRSILIDRGPSDSRPANAFPTLHGLLPFLGIDPVETAPWG